MAADERNAQLAGGSPCAGGYPPGTPPGVPDLPRETSNASDGGKVTLGICCMRKKLESQPMQAILTRMESGGVFEIVVFQQEMIINEPVEEWPKVRCLISFASSGFPLAKAIEYVNLVNPVLVNSVEEQALLSDRVAVYRKLLEWGIPCPDHMVVDHTNIDQSLLKESADEIVFNGRTMRKPFVEKPQDGDDHNVWIYYPQSDGGGAKKLFRKNKDKSSDFDINQRTIRRDGTYLYEPFLTTHGTDIKVYTVGHEYIHAEARKAPTIDGKVQRSADGKEIRYPVNPSQIEKAMATLIIQAFQQKVCGFDILRTASGESIVCDVNGWSFVKGNQKFYNDAGAILREILLEGLKDSRAKQQRAECLMEAPQNERIISTLAVSDGGPFKVPRSKRSKKGELRCVIVVMRHADRRPKEKKKFTSKLPEILDYFKEQEDDAHASIEESSIERALKGTAKDITQLANTKSEREVMIKRPDEMQHLKDIMAGTMQRLWAALRDAKAAKDEEKVQDLEREIGHVSELMEVLQKRDRFSGMERKVQLKAVTNESKVDKVTVVAKHGGELTLSGLQAAETLGVHLRKTLYPNDDGKLLRLHASFDHDFKCYSSQEGRCQSTAASFTRGFLDLQGDPTPILAALVMRDDYAQMLLDEPVPKAERDLVKARIVELLSGDNDFSDPDFLKHTCPDHHPALKEAAMRMGRTKDLLERVKEGLQKYVGSIRELRKRMQEIVLEESRAAEEKELAEQEEQDEQQEASTGSESQSFTANASVVPRQADSDTIGNEQAARRLRCKETRWDELVQNFCKKGTYDVSKIPEAWDNVFYDLTQSRDLLDQTCISNAEALVPLLQPLNDWVAWSEYGISRDEKLRIGADVTQNLLRKILQDFEFMLKEEIEGIVGEEHAGGPEGKYVTEENGQGEDQSVAADRLRKAFAISSKEWHPKLTKEVSKITGVKSKKMKSRIYVTSASTMHSIMNILLHGGEAGQGLGDGRKDATDVSLNYLSHLVLRCYETPREKSMSFSDLRSVSNSDLDLTDKKQRQSAEARLKTNFKVEISMSPGACCLNSEKQPEPWPKGSELSKENIGTAALEVMNPGVSLNEFENYLRDVLRKFCSKRTSLSSSPSKKDDD
mmetsp:Transcript_7635/g.16836  ORF Transcript_7635/g.16836 Transcript_7635/m.16836 type:complete len:1122 (-) Transcript_7635:55-3420(-)